MNKKLISILLIFSILLCGCQNTQIDVSDNESSDSKNQDSSSVVSSTSESSSTSSSTSSTTTSTESREPNSSDNEEQNSSSDNEEPNSPDNENSGSSGNENPEPPEKEKPLPLVPPITEKTRPTGNEVVKPFGSSVPEGETLVIKSGEILTLVPGERFTVDGKIECEDGGFIVVDEGAQLLLNGEIELNGLLYIEKNAMVDGGGALTLCDSFNDIECRGSFFAKIIPPTPVVTNGVTTIGGVVIANKKITLPPNYGNGLTAETLNALAEMRADSGFPMTINSGFRDYYTQVYIYNYWCSVYGEAEASRISAKAGTSEHQTGLTMDITSAATAYGDTPEGIWLGEHCYEYGFIIRYPNGKEAITGYAYEPWHVRYLGKSTARLVHDSGLTLEEFLGVEG